MTVPPLKRANERLARSPDLEHLGPALRAFALGRRTAILHGDLNCVFDLTLRLALHAIRFCCHLGYLRLVPAHSLTRGRFPLEHAPKRKKVPPCASLPSA